MVDLRKIRLGMTRDELRAALGEPELLGGTSRRQRTPVIWKYAEIEFHFNPAGELWLVHQEPAPGDYWDG